MQLASSSKRHLDDQIFVIAPLEITCPDSTTATTHIDLQTASTTNSTAQTTFSFGLVDNLLAHCTNTFEFTMCFNYSASLHFTRIIIGHITAVITPDIDSVGIVSLDPFFFPRVFIFFLIR